MSENTTETGQASENRETEESTSEIKVKEPLLHISRRGTISAKKAWGIRGIAFLTAIILNALFALATAGIDPISVYSIMIGGVFGNASSLWYVLTRTAKLLCIAVALAPAFKMRFWNIGAEGQMLVGALISAMVMQNLSSLPTPVMLLLMMIGSIVAGAVWVLIPTVFKAKFNTNETLFTLMMNYVAIQIVNHFCNVWRGNNSTLGVLNQTTQKGWLASLFGNGMEDFFYVLIILVTTVVMYTYLKYTKHGYEITVVGESHNTARYAGISVNKVFVRTMAISGAVCGLCGFLTVSGQSHTINPSITEGYGFTAIIVAWLSKFNTLAMILVSFLVVFLQKGSSAISDTYSMRGFDSSASSIFTAIFLLAVIASEFFINYTVKFRKKEEKNA